MPKITDKVTEWRKQNPGKTPFSFEYFPPKTEAGVRNLTARMEKMGQMRPMWIDVTWGAGGSTANTTLSLCETAMDVTGLDVLMHLTCTNVTVDETRQVLQRCKEKGLCNILALRGDPPANATEWTATEGGFSHAVDLVRFIRKEFGDFFCIGVAAYPEGHIDAESFDKDLQYYKEKVDAGADFGVTQLFYDTNLYFEFLKKSHALGVPKSFDVFPGIMPIQSYAGFRRMTGLCKTFVPKVIDESLELIKDNENAVKEYGIELAVQMSRELMDGGCPGLHLYTLNLEKSATAICEKLGLVDESLKHKEYPFNRSTGTRGVESTRPIFWAQRAKSYVERTNNWNEFPDGRFGQRDAEMFKPASRTHSSEDLAKKLSDEWSFSDEVGLSELFVKFLTTGSDVTQLPWCQEKPGLEMVGIRSQLCEMCRAGMLTINSQARVNGALSTDLVYGWGPAGGVVYQKAYVEFFCSPAMLKMLKEHFAKKKDVDWMAISKSGDMQTSPNATGPVTAVTWGVFPGREIQQPTVVDAASFKAWKDEAFALWDMFLEVNTANDAQKQTVNNIAESWFLVNVVDNNFLSGDLFKGMIDLTTGSAAKRGALRGA
jgi:methylenetetrahydrofolate reductase (NADPH)